MTTVNAKYSQEYLNDIKNTFKRMDDVKNGGNGNGKVDLNEAYNDLDIPYLLANQNQEDTIKIETASRNIKEALKNYAGDDGEFSAEEWADFINGKEWGAVLNAWSSSEKFKNMDLLNPMKALQKVTKSLESSNNFLTSPFKHFIDFNFK